MAATAAGGYHAPEGAAHHEELEEMLRTAFVLLDMDADGYISPAELSIALRLELDNRFPGVASDTVDALTACAMRAADLDGDGLLSPDEFVKSFKRSPGSGVVGWETVNRLLQCVGRILGDDDVALLRRVFRIGDVNGDGFLDLPELSGLLLSHLQECDPGTPLEQHSEMVSRVLRQADADHDGRLSLYEFLRSFVMDQGVLPPEMVAAVHLPLAAAVVQQLREALATLPPCGDSGCVAPDALETAAAPLLQPHLGGPGLARLLVRSAAARCRTQAGDVPVEGFLDNVQMGGAPADPTERAVTHTLSGVPTQRNARWLSVLQTMCSELHRGGRADEATNSACGEFCAALGEGDLPRARAAFLAAGTALDDLLCLSSVAVALEASGGAYPLLGVLFAVLLPNVTPDDLPPIAAAMSSKAFHKSVEDLRAHLQDHLELMVNSTEQADQGQWDALTRSLSLLADAPWDTAEGGLSFAALGAALSGVPAAAVALALGRAARAAGGSPQDVLRGLVSAMALGAAGVDTAHAAVAPLCGPCLRQCMLEVTEVAATAFGIEETALAIAQFCRADGPYQQEQAKRIAGLLGPAAAGELRQALEPPVPRDETSFCSKVLTVLTAASVPHPIALYCADALIAAGMHASSGVDYTPQHEEAATRIQSAQRCRAARAERRERGEALAAYLSRLQAGDGQPAAAEVRPAMRENGERKAAKKATRFAAPEGGTSTDGQMEAQAATKIQSVQRGQAARREAEERRRFKEEQRARRMAAEQQQQQQQQDDDAEAPPGPPAARVPQPPPPRAGAPPRPTPEPDPENRQAGTPRPQVAPAAASPLSPGSRPATAPPHSAVRRVKERSAVAAIATDMSGCAVSNDQLLYEWRKFETNGTGFVSRSAFRRAYMAMEWCGLQPKSREVDVILNAADDRLSYDEFCLLMLRRARI